MPASPIAPSHDPDASPPEWLAVVAEKVRSLRFGVVQITVHEGRVTQVEVTEKTRFEKPPGHRATDAR